MLAGLRTEAADLLVMPFKLLRMNHTEAISNIAIRTGRSIKERRKKIALVICLAPYKNKKKVLPIAYYNNNK